MAKRTKALKSASVSHVHILLHLLLPFLREATAILAYRIFPLTSSRVIELPHTQLALSLLSMALAFNLGTDLLTGRAIMSEDIAISI